MSILPEVVGQFLFRFTRGVQSIAIQRNLNFWLQSSRKHWSRMVLSTSRWAYLPLKNTVTEKLPHGIISGRPILILKLLMLVHQMKDRWTSKRWPSNSLETAEAIRFLYNRQINFSYLLGKSNQCGIKFWDIGVRNRLTWIVCRERWQWEERSKLQCTLICQPYWERVASGVSKPLLCHLLDVHQGKKKKPKAQRRRENNPPKGWQPERQ